MSILPDVAAADNFRGDIRLRPGLRHLARDRRSGGRLREGAADLDLAGPTRFFFFSHPLYHLGSDPRLLSDRRHVHEDENYRRKYGKISKPWRRPTDELITTHE